MAAPSRRPISTYRLQLGAGFRFADAHRIVPYLQRLGISDCYSSPLLKATPGSTHGYDICDHGQLNSELGTEVEFTEWCRALQASGLGHILDFVPNHMSCNPQANPWWRDVLENGPSSPFANYFDIDWDPIKPELKGKVLLPLLGDQYGCVLERGELKLRFDDGVLHLVYFEHDLPINPRQSPRVLGHDLDRLEARFADDPALREYLSILTALHNLPPYTERDPTRIVERQREKEVARERLLRLAHESAAIREHIDTAVSVANGTPGNRASFDQLHELLEHQAYRLAYWRTAVDEINYRRFFDINDLVGVRVEEPEVFAATHRLLKRMIGAGQVTGIRIDHPDGLFDPSAYFDRLQNLANEARRNRDDCDPFYVVAEKVLSDGESLRADWRVAGTTGYSFLNLVTGLFVDGRQARKLRRIYAQMTGKQKAFDEVAYQSKRTILLTAMASELNVLAHELNRISERDRRRRDFTLNSCRKVLREVLACFPVYRTYISARGVDAVDRAAILEAIRRARQRNPLMETSIFEFLGDISVPASDESSTAADSSTDERQFVMKLQQLSGPVHAKGVEDTAFYRYNVLTSVNEVGGHPGRLGVTPADFHQANAQRLTSWPLEMTTTSTHDTKRGEDARARLCVLSEMPDLWRSAVGEWMRINARHRSKIGGSWAPDRNDQYLFYQTLLAVWPATSPHQSATALIDASVVQRVSAYMQKAAREAKVHTSWLDEDRGYGHAIERFVQRTLTGQGSQRFLRLFVPFQRRVSFAGMLNSLAQVVLKLAAPGVADFYQGNELWDFSLVDPDNRRPVNFDQRQQRLDELMPLIKTVERRKARDKDLRALLDRWPDGGVKLFVTACGLRFRRHHAAVCLDGEYLPLNAEGSMTDHVVAFARDHSSGTLLAVVPRFVVSLTGRTQRWPLGSRIWGSTRIPVDSLPASRYRHLFTGQTISVQREKTRRWINAAELFHTTPFALLWARSIISLRSNYVDSGLDGPAPRLHTQIL